MKPEDLDAIRPDLSETPEEVRAYIAVLEAELARLASPAVPPVSARPIAPAEPSEPATTVNVITISRNGYVKRTPRHLYGRQRRGGMGVFDIDLAEDDAPGVIALADESDTLLLFTDDGRAFRLPVGYLPESAVRARGRPLDEKLNLRPRERVVAALSEGGGQYVVLLSRRGWVRRIRAGYLGKTLIQGTSFHDVKDGGPLVSACWTTGGDELFLATLEGKAIRFAESHVAARGCLGIRIDITDSAVAVTAVNSGAGVFLLTQDGLGTIRLMSGFSLNKAPGAGGKAAMKTSALVGAATVRPTDDLFVISRLGKIVRFAAEDVPAKEGVVQGVNCLALRADEAVAVAVAPNSPPEE